MAMAMAMAQFSCRWWQEPCEDTTAIRKPSGLGAINLCPRPRLLSASKTRLGKAQAQAQASPRRWTSRKFLASDKDCMCAD
jgi:hypothetical protein